MVVYHHTDDETSSQPSSNDSLVVSSLRNGGCGGSGALLRSLLGATRFGKAAPSNGTTATADDELSAVSFKLTRRHSLSPRDHDRIQASASWPHVRFLSDDADGGLCVVVHVYPCESRHRMYWSSDDLDDMQDEYKLYGRQLGSTKSLYKESLHFLYKRAAHFSRGKSSVPQEYPTAIQNAIRVAVRHREARGLEKYACALIGHHRTNVLRSVLTASKRQRKHLQTVYSRQSQRAVEFALFMAHGDAEEALSIWKHDQQKSGGGGRLLSRKTSLSNHTTSWSVKTPEPSLQATPPALTQLSLVDAFSLNLCTRADHTDDDNQYQLRTTSHAPQDDKAYEQFLLTCPFDDELDDVVTSGVDDMILMTESSSSSAAS